MIISCGSCGKGINLPHTGKPEDIEASIDRTITDGWRYVPSYEGYVCPDCRKDNPDKLYEMYVGKIKTSSKTNSYKILCRQMVQFISMLGLIAK